MKKIVIVAMVLVVMFTSVSVVSANLAPCGTYEGDITINGNVPTEDQKQDLYILIMDSNTIVGNDTVKMYMKKSQEFGGVAFEKGHTGEVATFYLKDYCGNLTKAITSPLEIIFPTLCESQNITVSLTFTGVLYPVEPTPTPTPTPTPKPSTPSRGGGGGGGGGGGVSAQPGATLTPTPTPSPTPEPGPIVTPIVIPTLIPMPTPVPELPPKKSILPLIAAIVGIISIIAVLGVWWKRRGE